jgi:hypothetical protein
MAVSINWGTYVISVPQADLTLVTGTLYDLDTDVFRLVLKSLEATDNGMVELRTHKHNTQVTIAGTTYARTLEIINGYKIEFEDGQYSVRLVGSNNNFFDIENNILTQNQVQVIPTNSAGLVVVANPGVGLTPQETADAVWDAPAANHQDVASMGEAQQADGSLTEQDKLDIADRVWDEALSAHVAVGSTGEAQGASLSAQEVADTVWDEATGGHTTSGTTGKALIDAGAAGNPWDSPLTGSNTDGTFGYLLQTTFVQYFNSIIQKISTSKFIKNITGNQPNQK